MLKIMPQANDYSYLATGASSVIGHSQFDDGVSYQPDSDMIKQKVSGTFRTPTGAETFCVIRCIYQPIFEEGLR